jgi:hypothetical protein
MKKITLFGLMFYVCSIFAQTPVTPPYTNDFNDAANFTGIWSFENPAGLGEWIYSADFFGISESGSVVFLPDGAAPSNNWLFSAPFNLTAGVSYALDFKYMNLSPGYQAHLKASIGTQAASASMTTEIVNIGAYDLNESNWNNYALSHTTFSVPTTGTYYIGFLDAGSVAPNMDGGQSIEEFSLATATGISDAAEYTVSLYPNPATDVVAIQLTSDKTSKVQIYNITGVLVKEVELNGSKSIDVSSLSNGVYVVKVSTEDKVLYSKLNIQ